MLTTSPQPLDIDACAEELTNFVASADPRISGPHEIAYGFGWAPSISYWIGKRRVHLYPDLCADTKPSPFAIEIADITDDANPIAQRCHVNEIGHIRDIMDRFLCQNVAIDTLADYEWIRDDLDHDKSIPDPPHRENPANFGGWVGGHITAGGPPQSKSPKSKPWWKLW